MATLSELPGKDIILAMRGVIDYACWRGIFYARCWPRRPSSPRSAPVQAAAAIFAAYSRALAYQTPQLVQAARIATRESLWTWKDITTAAAYGTLNWSA